MHHYLRVMFLIMCLPLAAIAQNDAEEEGQSSDDLVELSREKAEAMVRELERLSEAQANPLIHKSPVILKREYSGEWIEDDGGRICDGYLTRIASEEYCSSEPPDDWRSFEFDGDTYYVVPVLEEE